MKKKIKFRLPSEIPLDVYPKPDEFIEEGIKIVDEAREKSITLRIMGGMGIYILIRGSRIENLWKRLGRLGKKVFTDIDLAGYGRDRDKILSFLTKERKNNLYFIWQPSLYQYSGSRYIFYGSPEEEKINDKKISKIPMVEVFFDQLQMNHTISFKGKLEKERYTLPPTELLLTKLQIVKINEKDIKDAIILIRAYEIGNKDERMINGEYIARVMSKDWGFYYTFTNNLKRVKYHALNEYKDILSDEDRGMVVERVDKLLKIIEGKPKTLRWKTRAKIGPKKKWYNEVDEWT